MEDPGIFFHALAYIAFIVLSGIAFLVCFILFVVRISQNHAHKWAWLAAGIGTLLLLLFSIFLFVHKVVNTVKNIGEHVEQKFTESIDELAKSDSSYHYNAYYNNETVRKLKEFESMNEEKDVPKEFYVYYGFNDYYRMPLTYPFSLHSNDVLETAELYNEKNVSEFNVNDNGEEEAGLEGIEELAFDNSAIIAKIRTGKGEKDLYNIFSFTGKKIAAFHSRKEAFETARKEFNYRGYDTLISVLDYNKLFN